MSLYLKYRPQDFQNLVWQDFIKNTLKTAVLKDKLVWAYLFCWPRWTWKTSSARIFAKSINCLDLKDWNPCLKCEICNDFSQDKLIDIIEIDAASHTWVDNIRELIQKAQFNPTKTKYKVYIIDEVHMLSKWAFNALLKILEEPPSHVKFILATTETHKVPETIISRCQRFDFKRISNTDIKERLEFIAKNENIQYDIESLEYIINNSWGWLRNAISLFEQYIINWEIKYENITKNLWLISQDEVKNFYNLLLEWNNNIVQEFDKLIDSWINIKLFFKDLFFVIKNDSIIKSSKWLNINLELFILEVLDELFIKVKNSYDENTTFLIWILKILNFISFWKDLDTKKLSNKKIENIKIENKELSKIEKNKEENISNDDISNIFSDFTSPQPSSSQEEEVKYIQKDVLQEKWNFDSNKYIEELKKNWAKWALIFSLKWAIFDLDWNVLSIKFKTKFALKSVDNSDNKKILLDWLEKLWILSWEINLK